MSAEWAEEGVDSGVVVNPVADVSDLPCALIVTNVPHAVFDGGEADEEFREIFAQFEHTRLEYFRSFKRVRITFSSPEAATSARIQCEGLPFRNVNLKCFFAQCQYDEDMMSRDDEGHLQLPPLEKQFLISPPSSPPVGWEQHKEANPVINLDLISRLAALGQDRATQQEPTTEELHPGSTSCPSIVVHICADDEGANAGRRIKPGICHTPCPPRNNTQVPLMN